MHSAIYFNKEFPKNNLWVSIRRNAFSNIILDLKFHHFNWRKATILQHGDFEYKREALAFHMKL